MKRVGKKQVKDPFGLDTSHHSPTPGPTPLPPNTTLLPLTDPIQQGTGTHLPACTEETSSS